MWGGLGWAEAGTDGAHSGHFVHVGPVVEQPRRSWAPSRHRRRPYQPSQSILPSVRMTATTEEMASPGDPPGAGGWGSAGAVGAPTPSRPQNRRVGLSPLPSRTPLKQSLRPTRMSTRGTSADFGAQLGCDRADSAASAAAAAVCCGEACVAGTVRYAYVPTGRGVAGAHSRAKPAICSGFRQ